MDYGQVGEVSKEIGIFHVKWRIDNFFWLSDAVDSCYMSSHFYFLNTQWFMKMFPNGQTKDASEGWIGLYLKRSSSGPPIYMRFTLAMRTTDEKEEKFISNINNTKFSKKEQGKGTGRFLQRSELLNRKSQLAPSGALTIVCRMWSDELPSAKDERLVSREVQTDDLADGAAREEDIIHFDIKGATILRKQFQDLLLDGKDHDVTLKVKDQKFRAHKNILRARSPVFAAMFAHNMTENESGDVCIEDCDPSAFGEFLKYVYVGKMENMSPSTSTGLYYVADKYNFPHLKETCVDFLKASLTTNVISDVITLAMNHGEDELLEYAMEFFSKHIMETLMTVEWQRFTSSNPILSNEVIIKAMKISEKH